MGIIKTSCLLGVDIRQDFIRLVELSCCGSEYRLEACTNLVLIESEMSDEVIISALKSVLEQVSPKTKDVAVAFSHTVVVFKEFQVIAGWSSKEIRKFLRFSLSEQLGKKNHNFVFDYQIIEEGVVTDNLVKLQAVAAQHSSVEKWVKLLHKAKLRPKVIDVDVYAIERTVRLQLKNIDGLTAVINVDYGQVLIIILDDKKIIYVNEDIFDQERLISINQILELFDAKLRLLDSILLQPLARLILGGEKAILPGLVEAVRTNFHLQVILANPFLNMKLSPGVFQEDVLRLSPLMLTSCGLALRVKDDNKN